MCLFTGSDLPDTDNTVLFENTTPINPNKKDKIKEQIDQINQNGIFEQYNVVSVYRQIWVSKRMHPYTSTIGKIQYSRGSLEVPMN